VELSGNRLTCECSAVDADGRQLGSGTTVQAVLSEEDLQARLGEPTRARAGDAVPDAG
jgi:predicted thioesterase